MGLRRLWAAATVNDVSTDLFDRPQLSGDKHRKYTRRRKRQIEAAYPELQPLWIHGKSDDVFARVLESARAQPGWTIKSHDRARGRIRGYAQTGTLKFVDDFVMRIRSEGERTRIDMRSRSRRGRGDLGANARRIRKFFRALSS